MKIIITEKQMKRLIENIESLGNPDPNTLPEFSNKISVTASIEDEEGDLDSGKPTTGDDIARKTSPQSPYSHGRMIVSRQG